MSEPYDIAVTLLLNKFTCEINLLFTFRDPSAAYISTSQIDAVLPEPTPFLRFDVVNLNYRPGQQPIAARVGTREISRKLAGDLPESPGDLPPL